MFIIFRSNGYCSCALFTLILDEGKTFKGVIDIVTMRKVIWDSSDAEGSSYNCVPIDKDKERDVYESACEARTQLIDRLADFDSLLFDKIIEEVPYEKISPVDILRALRTATIHHKQVPLLCGSSFKNKGVQPLLNSIINLLPNPTERHHEFLDQYKNSLCALAFKIVPNHRHGPLTFVRIYSGKLSTGASVYNANRNCNQSVERLFEVLADDFKLVKHAEAGNIVAVMGLPQVQFGCTLKLCFVRAYVIDSDFGIVKYCMYLCSLSLKYCAYAYFDLIPYRTCFVDVSGSLY